MGRPGGTLGGTNALRRRIHENQVELAPGRARTRYNSQSLSS
jgi:hypothetical protein